MAIALQSSGMATSSLGHPFSTPGHAFGRRALALINRVSDEKANGITSQESQRRQELLTGTLGEIWFHISGDYAADGPPIASAPTDWNPPAVAMYYNGESLWSHLDRPLNEEQLIRHAKDYLAMPWARDPWLDWLLLSTLLFSALRADIYDLRAVLVSAATNKLGGIPDELRTTSISDLKYLAAKAILINKVKHVLSYVAVLCLSAVILYAGLTHQNPSTLLWLMAALAGIAFSGGLFIGFVWVLRFIGRAFIGKNAADQDHPATKLMASIEDVQKAAKLYDELGRDPISTRRLREVIIPTIAANHVSEPVLVALADRLVAEGPVFVPSPIK